jgi:hypothetical protein
VSSTGSCSVGLAACGVPCSDLSLMIGLRFAWALLLGGERLAAQPLDVAVEFVPRLYLHQIERACR